MKKFSLFFEQGFFPHENESVEIHNEYYIHDEDLYDDFNKKQILNLKLGESTIVMTGHIITRVK